MKIVQSLWSRPARSNSGLANAGWPDRKYHYLSWTLSALQFSAFYPELELVTDKEGYDLLINKLELPYTTVRVVLDELNDYHPELFALGKIAAYRLQEQPFIHADSDVFIWERFPDPLLSASLICQNIDDGQRCNRLYSLAFMELVNRIGYYPEVLDASLNRNNRIVSVNAGILGGTDTDFFRHYTRAAFDFVDRIGSKIERINVKDFNTIFEQFLFFAMAEEMRLKISCYKQGPAQFRYEIADFTLVPGGAKYIHLIGHLKRSRPILEQLEHRLLTDHPTYYFRIINLIRKNHI